MIQDPMFTSREMLQAGASMHSGAASRLTGATHRQLAHWDEIGLVNVPREERGKVTRRLYSLERVLCAALIRELKARGIGPLTVRTVLLEQLRSACNRVCASVATFERGWLLTDGNELVVESCPVAALARAGWRDWVAVDLAEMLRKVME